MAILHTEKPSPALRIFRLVPGGRNLSEIPHPIWQQIIDHERPLQPANGSIKVLLLWLTQLPGEVPEEVPEAPSAEPCTAPSGAREPSDWQQRATPQRPSECTQIDALRLQTDEFGFLMTWDATGLTAGRHTATTRVFDARHLFLQRHIAHRHSWQPEPELLTQALALLNQNSTVSLPR